MQGYPFETSNIIYLPILFLLIYWLYRHYHDSTSKKSDYDEYYDSVLKSDKYKVKGKFEQH
jgi:hypothetical protein